MLSKKNQTFVARDSTDSSEKAKKEELEYIEDIDEGKGGEEIKKKIKKLKDKLKKYQEEREEYLKGWQKERADFINYRKEEENRKNVLKNFIKGGILLEFLAVLDNLERAEKEIPNNIKENEWVNGIIGIKKQIKDILKKEGVEEMPVKNKFDPIFHEAVIAEKGNEDEILEVLQKGYLFNGKVLRPARVKVGKSHH